MLVTIHLPLRTLATSLCGCIAGRDVRKERAKWNPATPHERASVRIDVTIKSTGKLMFFPTATVGPGIGSDFQGVSYDSSFGGMELSALKSWVSRPAKGTVGM